MNAQLHKWIYATRPHTLGASISPMLLLLGAIVRDGVMQWGYFLLCLLVAISAQISSNFANDYFGYKSGEDTDHRLGFTRLLSTGKVTPQQMLIALGISLTICAGSGLFLASQRGWWLLLVGAVVILCAIAYSAGKYSLARTALGDLAVVIFYGLVPILVSYYVIADTRPQPYLVLLALGIGIWETNILVCNNYRDYKEDIESHKLTLIARMGRKSGPLLYLINALLSLLLIAVGLIIEGSWVGAIVLALLSTALYANGILAIYRLKGKSLNKLLRYTNITTLIVGVVAMIILLI
ncbi:1,4-dihydroxy-2-naphthoate octaprenyltransferase [uncultured Porphyromonas sp.]|uniref:1,4-dihydroxy-2-naphthoate octaprenyltransferase n=1 Tax=uncultured Porphyromonas sp. TaxID=159274 RepID=UPI0026269312|nr:1,4-dihydroxy-2-naphthoate octaprenyltransferase [uncultured Porphyromonas sp.]